MKYLTAFVLLFSTLFFSVNSFSAELEYASRGGSSVSFSNIKQSITDITARIAALDAEIALIEGCYSNDPLQFYNGTNCVNMSETDPDTSIHGKTGIPLNACGGTGGSKNQALYFDGSSWTCKIF